MKYSILCIGSGLGLHRISIQTGRSKQLKFIQSRSHRSSCLSLIPLRQYQHQSWQQSHSVQVHHSPLSRQVHWECENFRGDSRNPGSQELYSTRASKAPQNQCGENPWSIDAASSPSLPSSRHTGKKPTHRLKLENSSSANMNFAFLDKRLFLSAVYGVKIPFPW